MRDLTRSSIVSHILHMARPIMVGMVTIMIWQLVDLYFVSGLGEAAVAGVAAAGNAGFLVNALMQMLGVGTVALIAHAVGRKDRGDANLVFNQSVVLSVLFGLSTLLAGFALARPYMRAIEHAGAGACRGHQYRAGAGPDHGLGHRTRARCCRSGPCKFARRLHRRADAARVFPQAGALRRVRS